MFRVLLAVAAALLVCLPLAVVATDNGLARLPPMGWNTWYTDALWPGQDWCNEAEIMSVADAMASNGMKELGYTYINLDDCWGGPRAANGSLTADTSRFPSGSLQPLADYIHGLGLRFGVYLCAGTTTCRGNRPGSWGYFEQDAATMAQWSIDYVKMDWCHHPALAPEEVYGNFSRALNATGHAAVFEVCSWGEGDPWLWGSGVANVWRVANDHMPWWWGPQGIAGYTKWMANISSHAGPGGWNYADLMMTMAPLTMDYTLSVTEFSLWSLWASPLVVCTDIRDMDQRKQSILLNADVIAVNQDPLARAGDIVVRDDALNIQIWAKPLADGSLAVVLLNADDLLPRAIALQWQQLPGWPAAATALRIRDLWEHQDLAVGSGLDYTSPLLPPHAVNMVRVWPA